jgi:hypothetical protein
MWGLRIMGLCVWYIIINVVFMLTLSLCSIAIGKKYPETANKIDDFEQKIIHKLYPVSRVVIITFLVLLIIWVSGDILF